MKRIFTLFSWLCIATLMMAEMQPIFIETFDGCLDEEGENYGFTGGNDNQWGGNIATAIAIYTDNDDWSFTYCNGAKQCIKVGTSTKQGYATTPTITHTGDAVLTCRVAPWEGDSIFTVSIKGGTPIDPTSFELKKNKWTDITIRIADINGSLRITFGSLYKHRFFLDDVCVRPSDPNAGAIRTDVGSTLDWGLVGTNYEASKRFLRVTGVNLADEGISLTLKDGEPGLFVLSEDHLPAQGGKLTITCRTNASEGMHGTNLYLKGKDRNNGQVVEKKVALTVEVAYIDLEGAGTRPNPFICADVITLAENEGTVWTGTYYWVTGCVLGGVKRYNDQYDGISTTDQQALVLADAPDETDDSKYVTVQIKNDARAALNVVDNPELIGVRIKVCGLLLNDNANPYYLGKPGVREVSTKEQYWRPNKEAMDETDPMDGAYDPDEPVDPYDPGETAVEQTSDNLPLFNPALPAYTPLGVRVDGNYRGIVIQNGHTYLR